MHIRMRNAESLSQAQISEFLKASEGIEFAGQGRAEVYGWVQQMLVNQEYARQERKPRGAIPAAERTREAYWRCSVNPGLGQSPMRVFRPGGVAGTFQNRLLRGRRFEANLR